MDESCLVAWDMNHSRSSSWENPTRWQKQTQWISVRGVEQEEAPWGQLESRDISLYLFDIYYVFIYHGAYHPADPSCHVHVVVPGKLLNLYFIHTAHTLTQKQYSVCVCFCVHMCKRKKRVGKLNYFLLFSGLLFRSIWTKVAGVSKQEGSTGQQKLLQRTSDILFSAAVRV